MAIARRKARIAKVSFLAIGVVAFSVSAAAARFQQPGHIKKQSRELNAPKDFVDVVTQNALQGGMLGPTIVSPQIETSVS